MKNTIMLFVIIMIFNGYNESNGAGSVYDHDGYRYVFNKKGKYLEYYGADNKKIANIMFFDNGPDYYSEGLRRIVENGKYGFINRKNQIVIPAQFGFAFSFADGFAKVIKKPRYEKVGEHSVVVGESWGLINKSGEIVVPMKYRAILDYTNSSATVITQERKKITVRW